MKKVQLEQKKSFKKAIILCLFIVSGGFFAGCDDNNRILDPSQVGRFRPVPAVNVILNTLGVEEEEPPAWADAEDPLPEDGIYQQGNYTFSTGDTVRVSIFELLQEGFTFTNDYIVDEGGKITIAEVGVIEVAGLTERQLEEEIYSILKPAILKEPFVTVTLMNSQKRTFSIAGVGIRAAGGRFSIPRTDFRLLDAIAQAGGMAQFNVTNVYVSRQVKTGQKAGQLYGYKSSENPAKPLLSENPSGQQQMLNMISPNPADSRQSNDSRGIITPSELATQIELFKKDTKDTADSINLLENLAAIKTKPLEEDNTEWIFKDGKYIAVPAGQKEKIEKFLEQQKQLPVQQQQPVTEQKMARLIRIPVDKLVTGDPKYNIVIREGDVIHVPVDLVGEFCVMGNVNSRQGFFDITGRPLTLKMAIAAAGGLSVLCLA